MKTIYCNLSIGYGSREDEIEVEDDATEDEIQEVVKEWAMNYVEWGWSETKPSAATVGGKSLRRSGSEPFMSQRKLTMIMNGGQPRRASPYMPSCVGSWTRGAHGKAPSSRSARGRWCGSCYAS